MDFSRGGEYLSAMENYLWNLRLKETYLRATEAFRNGERNPENLVSTQERKMLDGWGLRPIHLFDHIEDCAGGGDPSFETTLLIFAVRRDFFLYMQEGKWADHPVPEPDLPLRSDELDGIEWLPRIIAKARCFLEGRLCPDVMFYCGGDRAFLRAHDLHPADFLRAVWASHGDDGKISQFVRGLC